MNVRIGLFCLLGGLFFTIPALGAGNFGWWWFSGLLVSAALVPVVRFGPRKWLARWLVIFAILEVIGLLCTISEGVVFFPEKKASMLAGLVGGSIAYLIAAALLATLAKTLKLAEAEELTVEHRSWTLAAAFVALSGASYVLYYEVFGAITFQYFTKPYYPHAVAQVMAMGNWFLAYQWMRGLLMTLALVPAIYSVRLPRWQLAVVCGALAWVVGGLAPLMVPNDMMPDTLRYMHMVEIMTQNVSLGVTAALLLRPGAKAAKSIPHAAVA